MGDSSAKPLAALALAAFGIGTTEFVIMGLLPDVARDLGTTIPAAGLLVSGYALGVAFGGPSLAVALARLPARRALLALMALFVIGNIGCALAPGYSWLMVARIVTAFCHAAFFGIGAVIAAALAPPDRRARAVATMISGLTIAIVLGVPLGTMIGQASGWRTTFLAVATIGLVALAALARWVPEIDGERRDLRVEMRVLARPAVLVTLAISVVASTGMFAFFTYITPILTDIAHVPAARVSWVLLACGIGLTMGNAIGARLADWRALPSLIGILTATGLLLVGMQWTLVTPLSATVSVTAWGIVAFAVCAVLQAEILARSSDAPNLASTLNISAFNLGNAIGAGLGAAAISGDMGLSGIPSLAAGFALLAVGLAIAALRMRRPETKPLPLDPTADYG